METIYKIILVNLGTLIGFVAVLFTLLYNASFTLLGIRLLIALVLMNVAVVLVPGYCRKLGISLAEPKLTTAELIVIWISFLPGQLWKWTRWHHR